MIYGGCRAFLVGFAVLWRGVDGSPAKLVLWLSFEVGLTSAFRPSSEWVVANGLFVSGGALRVVKKYSHG